MSGKAEKFQYSNSGQKLAIGLLAIVLIITIGLGIYNSMMESKLTQLDTTLAQHEATIKELKADKNVFVYDLVTLHQTTLNELDKRSQITEYINHLEEVSSSYNVSFREFNISNGVVSTKALFNTNDSGIAYNKAIRFIGDYRKSQKALFDLEFVSQVESTDVDVKFPVEFTLK